MNIHNIIFTLAEQTGVDAQAVYCQSTGKPIGIIDLSEIELAIQISGLTDEEEIRDELLIRTLASARPSPAWNYIRVNTLDELRKREPKTVLAYLFNLFAEPVDRENKLTMSLERRIGLIHERIKIYNSIQALDIDAESIEELTYILIELHAKFGLTNLAMPPEYRQLWLTLPADERKVLTQNLSAWRDKLIFAELEKQKHAVQSTRAYQRGPVVAKLAFIKKLTEKEKNAKRIGDMFDELEAVLSSPPENTIPTLTPKPKPVVKSQSVTKLSAGFKFGVKKMESVG